ncbi:MAG: translation initiation factor IF-3, partial [Bacilli bacterium]|nr:translation initiation factor IF-3 [Bacilli bacterium]
DKFSSRLVDIATIEQAAKLDGRTMIMLLAPKKEK